jgi:mono/diheme cytochrome c family protein
MTRPVLTALTVLGVVLVTAMAWRMLRQRSLPARSSAAPASRDPVARGRQAYFKHCEVCHSPDSEDAANGPSLMGYFSRPPTKLSDGTLFPRTDEAVRGITLKGTRNMPPLDKEVTAQELDDILVYMHTL